MNVSIIPKNMSILTKIKKTIFTFSLINFVNGSRSMPMTFKRIIDMKAKFITQHDSVTGTKQQLIKIPPQTHLLNLNCRVSQPYNFQTQKIKSKVTFTYQSPQKDDDDLSLFELKTPTKSQEKNQIEQYSQSIRKSPINIIVKKQNTVSNKKLLIHFKETAILQDSSKTKYCGFFTCV